MTLAQMADILDKARKTIGELIGEPEKLAAFATERFLALGK